MGKLKTVEEALGEIYMNHGLPPLQTSQEFREALEKLVTDLKEMREIEPEILMGKNQIINDYFETERGPLIRGIVQYKDRAGNVYQWEWECIQSFLDESYNRGAGEENG